MTYTSHIFPTSTRFEHKLIQVSQALNCLEDSTMRNRRHTQRRRGCPRIANNNYIPSLEDWHYIPAHPRYTRMYGVTHSTVFQTVLNLRNLSKLIS